MTQYKCNKCGFISESDDDLPATCLTCIDQEIEEQDRIKSTANESILSMFKDAGLG